MVIFNKGLRRHADRFQMTQLISDQCFYSIPPHKTRKQGVFKRFSGVFRSHKIGTLTGNKLRYDK